MLGETIGNFRVVAKIGCGGMGDLFVAEQLSVRTRVAIKMLRLDVSADRTHVQRFFNEAVAVSRIQHAGIVRIFDVGFHASGRAYLIMELLEGETLASRIRRSGRLSIGHLAELGRQIASVLDATHAAGVTHRDLKPENVFVVPDRELGERVKVLDFGIAKLAGTVVTTGSLGTPSYMAPEQWRSAATVDWRTDAYALGCLAFEMACGRPPFVAESIGEACTQHLAHQPPRARSLVGELPIELDELIARLLDKSPERRASSMADIGCAFAMIGRGQPRPLDATIAPPPLRRPRRWIAVAVGVGGVVAGLAGYVVARDHAEATAVPVATNRWVRVEPPARAMLLGVDSDSAPADRRGFRPARGVMAPTTAYEIQAHEVTWSELEPWLAARGPIAFPTSVDDPAKRRRMPATGIVWSTAYAYCKSIGGALPTEEQWELAARGAERRPNPWGDARLDPMRTHAFGGRGAQPMEVETHDQDRTPAPAIYDLAGNVQEWTADLWREDAPGRDESWVEDGETSYRAIRGFPLRWSNPRIQPDSAAFREPMCATGPCVARTRERLAYIGFRCVREVGDTRAVDRGTAGPTPGERVGIDGSRRDDRGGPGAAADHHAAASGDRRRLSGSGTNGRSILRTADRAARAADRGSDAAQVPLDPYPTDEPAPPPCDGDACRGSSARVDDDAVADAHAVAAPTGDAATSDTIDRAMIAAAIARIRPRIDDCAINFAGVGRVKVSVAVAADGAIATVTVGETSSRWLGGCVATQLRKATLPATKRGGSFSYAFAF